MSTRSSVSPLARRDDLVITPDNDDLVIYDVQRATLHRLDATMTSVWRRCDGAHSVETIALATGVPAGGVEEALTHLAEEGLLSGPVEG